MNLFKMSVYSFTSQKTKPVHSFVNFWDDKYKSSGLTTKFLLQDIVGQTLKVILFQNRDNIPLAVKVKSIYPKLGYIVLRES